jgi:hypothetical protein
VTCLLSLYTVGAVGLFVTQKKLANNLLAACKVQTSAPCKIGWPVPVTRNKNAPSILLSQVSGTPCVSDQTYIGKAVSGFGFQASSQMF